MSILRKPPTGTPAEQADNLNLRATARINHALAHLDTHTLPYLATLRRTVGTTGQPHLADVADEVTNLLLDLRAILTGGASP